MKLVKYASRLWNMTWRSTEMCAFFVLSVLIWTEKRHIENNHRENGLQAQALDLTSPGKRGGYKSIKKTQKRKEQDMKEIKETEPLDSTDPSRCQDKAEIDIEGCLIDVAQIEAQDLSTYFSLWFLFFI